MRKKHTKMQPTIIIIIGNNNLPPQHQHGGEMACAPVAYSNARPAPERVTATSTPPRATTRLTHQGSCGVQRQIVRP